MRMRQVPWRYALFCLVVILASYPASSEAIWAGVASVAGRKAFSEHAERNTLVGASNSFPLGFSLLVINPRSGKSVKVEVVRRSTLPGDLLLLSYEAGEVLGLSPERRSPIHVSLVPSAKKRASSRSYLLDPDGNTLSLAQEAYLVLLEEKWKADRERLVSKLSSSRLAEASPAPSASPKEPPSPSSVERTTPPEKEAWPKTELDKKGLIEDDKIDLPPLEEPLLEELSPPMGAPHLEDVAPPKEELPPVEVTPPVEVIPLEERVPPEDVAPPKEELPPVEVTPPVEVIPLEERVPPEDVAPSKEELPPVEVAPPVEVIPLEERVPPEDVAPPKEELPPVEVAPPVEVIPLKESVPLEDVAPPKEELPPVEVAPPVEVIPLKESVPPEDVAPPKEELPPVEVAPPAEVVPLEESVPPPEEEEEWVLSDEGTPPTEITPSEESALPKETTPSEEDIIPKDPMSREESVLSDQSSSPEDAVRPAKVPPPQESAYFLSPSDFRPPETPVGEGEEPFAFAELYADRIIEKVNLEKARYLQLGVFQKKTTLYRNLIKINKKYPVIVLLNKEGKRTRYRLLLGPLSRDEEGILSYRFKKMGYRDLFRYRGP